MAFGRSHLIALVATAFLSRAFEVKSIKGKLAAKGFFPPILPKQERVAVKLNIQSNKQTMLLKGGGVSMSWSYGLNYAVGVFLKKTNGIGESKRAAKFAHGGVSDKIHSYATRARYCGIVKDFVENMRSEGARRVNQLKEDHVANYLRGKGSWTTEKTMKVNMSALTKFFKAMGREDLVETIEAHRNSILTNAKPSGQAVPFTDPERVIEKLRKPESKAIARIMHGCGARIDDVPKVVNSFVDNERSPGANITNIMIKKSKGGRDRQLHFDDRAERYEMIREAAVTLNNVMKEKNWKDIKAEFYHDLRLASDHWGETYSGAHAFRVCYAQDRFKELMEQKGMPERDGLQIVTEELGHNRVGMALGYITR